MQKIISEDDLRRIQGLSAGYLVNRNSNVNHGGRHVVHILPLVADCKGEDMGVTKNYPKYYVENYAELVGWLRSDKQGSAWDFGECCRERSEMFSIN